MLHLRDISIVHPIDYLLYFSFRVIWHIFTWLMETIQSTIEHDIAAYVDLQELEDERRDMANQAARTVSQFEQHRLENLAAAKAQEIATKYPGLNPNTPLYVNSNWQVNLMAHTNKFIMPFSYVKSGMSADTMQRVCESAYPGLGQPDPNAPPTLEYLGRLMKRGGQWPHCDDVNDILLSCPKPNTARKPDNVGTLCLGYDDTPSHLLWNFNFGTSHKYTIPVTIPLL